MRRAVAIAVGVFVLVLAALFVWDEMSEDDDTCIAMTTDLGVTASSEEVSC